MARLIPYQEQIDKRPLGLYRGKVIVHGDLLAPLPDEVVADFWPRGEGA